MVRNPLQITRCGLEMGMLFSLSQQIATCSHVLDVNCAGIPQEWLMKWKHLKVDENFHFPRPNPFVGEYTSFLSHPGVCNLVILLPFSHRLLTQAS